MEEDTTKQQKDFFVSYTGIDRTWAEWIAWQLEQAGYTTLLQAWDFHVGSNFVSNMHHALIEAKRLLCVISPEYFTSGYAEGEWTAAWRNDPIGEHRIIIPVRVRSGGIPGLFGSLVSIDLIDQAEDRAKELLLAGITSALQETRAKSLASPSFPGSTPTANAVHFPGILPSIWMIPYRRNQYFTGREPIITQMSTLLTSGTTPLEAVALVGLGGIGKTQTAIEYAYRYHDQYQAVLWIRANDLQSILLSFSEIATILQIPEHEGMKPEQLLTSVKHWCQNHADWLIVVDNADNLDEVSAYIPSGRGKVVLTTLRHATRHIAQAIPLGPMPQEEGSLLLLRMAKVIPPGVFASEAPEEERRAAEHLTEELGGLPLALDQAGAYIEEMECTLSDYLSFYREEQEILLQRRGTLSRDYHPHSVDTTWKISFERVEQQNPAAADLLRTCAFLAPDAIPEELLKGAGDELGPHVAQSVSNTLRFQEMVSIALRYSLIERNQQAHTLSIHRLVQTVLKDGMKGTMQKQWAMQVVHLVSRAFPFGYLDVDTWVYRERILPHALKCSSYIIKWGFTFLDASDLLSNTATYLHTRARYQEAEPLHQQALSIRKRVLGPLHPDVARSLNNLAILYRDQGKYEQSEPLHQQALSIRKRVLGPIHPDIAESLDNLANVYMNLDKYEEAESYHLRALVIYEQVRVPTHPDIARSLGNLATLYLNQDKYEQAEPLCQRALSIYEQVRVPTHPDIARSLGNLATLYLKQGKYEQAEPLYQRALSIYEQVHEPTHPDVARSLHNLASLYREQDKDEEVEPLYQRALTIHEQVRVPTHLDVARSLNNLASFYCDQGKYGQAEPFCQRALAIYEQMFEPTHPELTENLNNLATLYLNLGKYEQAEPLCQRALTIYEQVSGPVHPDVARGLNNLAVLYRAQNKGEEAEPLYQRALSIYEQIHGPTHLDVALSLGNLANLYTDQGKDEEAEPLYQRALSIYEQVHGLTHPDVARNLNNLANLYHDQDKDEQAELLYQRALSIREQTLRPTHPDMAWSLTSLATLYHEQGKYEEAEPLYRRALEIFQKSVGLEHPKTKQVVHSLAELAEHIQ